MSLFRRRTAGFTRLLRARAGFTFIELLIAITIYSVISLSLFSALRAGFKLWQGSEDQMQKDQGSRVMFSRISKDLKNAVVISKTTDVYSKDARFVFVGKASRLSFITLVDRDPGTGPETELARVTYEIVPDKKAVEKKIVVRTIATQSEGFDELVVADKAVQLLDPNTGPLGFKFAYKGTGDSYLWLEEWKEQGVIPRGVKIIAGNEVETVFVPLGKLGELNEERPA